MFVLMTGGCGGGGGGGGGSNANNGGNNGGSNGGGNQGGSGGNITLGIDGTWRIESGNSRYGHGTTVITTGTIDLNSVTPSQFEIRIRYEEGGEFQGYYIWFNESVVFGELRPGEVWYTWVKHPGGWETDLKSSITRLQRVSDHVYRWRDEPAGFNGFGFAREVTVEQLDDFTLRITSVDESSYGGGAPHVDRRIVNFERVR